jgi:hypothetical protein
MIPSPQKGCSPGSWRLKTAVTPFLKKSYSSRLHLELPDDVVLLDEAIGESLCPNDVVVDPIAVEALDCGVGAARPVLVLAGLPTAEATVQLRLLLEVDALYGGFLVSQLFEGMICYLGDIYEVKVGRLL